MKLPSRNGIIVVWGRRTIEEHLTTIFDSGPQSELVVTLRPIVICQVLVVSVSQSFEVDMFEHTH